MKYYGEPKIQKIEHRQCEYIRCDLCHKKIRGRYFIVDTGHHDWGNDSIDSLKTKEICENCIKEYTNDYLSNISNTGHINIESDIFIKGRNYTDEYDDFEDKLVANDKEK